MATLLADDDQTVGVSSQSRPEAPPQVPGRWDRVVAHRGWLSVRDRALAGLARRPALVVILGGAGAGKTVLIHEISRVLAASGIGNAVLSSRHAVDAWEELDVRNVLLIDDADRLDDAALARLATDERRLVVLTERPGFADRLIDLPLAATLLNLMPLARAEIAGFLTASVPEEDRAHRLFSDAAIDRLAARSAGVPRLLHDLAGTALFLARRERVAQATARHVDQAALVGEADIDLSSAPPVATQAPFVTRPRRHSEPDVSPREAARAPVLTPLARPADPTLAPSKSPRRPRSRHIMAIAAIGIPALGALALALRTPPRPVAPASTMTLATPVAPPSMVDREPAIPPHLPVRPPPEASPAVAFREPFAPALPLRPVVPPASDVIPSAEVAEPFPPPSAALTRVLIAYPANAPRAAQAAAMLAGNLRSQGFWVAEPSALATRAKPGIWFGFAEDQDAAMRIAALLPNHPVAAASPRPLPTDRTEPAIPGTVRIMISAEGDVP